MIEKFNMKEGLITALKTALKDENFVSSVFDMLLGHKDAAEQVEFELKSAAQENTLNEILAVHRLYKQTLNEGVIRNIIDKPKELIHQLSDIRKRSVKYQRKVLVRTLNKPGMLASFVYIIKALLTPGYPIDDLIAAPQAVRFIKALIETGIEVSRENEEAQLAVNEAVMIEKMRRMLKHGSEGKKNLSEEETVNRYGGRMPVNVYIGRFQPFHIGHLSNLEAGAKRGLRTVICPVKPGKTAKSQANHYFGGDLESEMFDRVREAYRDLVADIIPIDSPAPQNWVEQIRERGMEPITWTTGEDQKPSYENMIMRYGPDFNLVDDFEVIGLPKNVGAGGGSVNDKENIEGRAVRECLKNDDREGFMRQMPKCLWDMYDKMRSVLVGEREPAAALAEDKAYDEYKKMVDEAIERLVKGNK